MPTITATFDPTTNLLSLSEDTIPVNADTSTTITINLVTSPSPGGFTATFTESPITWGINGPPPVYSLMAGSDTLTIEETNNNNGPGSELFPFTINVQYLVNASQDPTIVNEGTGSVSPVVSAVPAQAEGASLRQQAA